jgi:serine/threonine protein kinase
MKVKYQSTGQTVFIDASLKIGSGGEGTVYEAPHNPSLAAKIYARHDSSNERSRKLKVMLEHAPLDPTKQQGHVSIAWPSDIILSADGSDTVVGYLMPRIKEVLPISHYYDVTIRHLKCPLFRYDYLFRTATNLASAVKALHESGYVIGDVNESNIMVTERAMVTLIDTDSFQVTDPDDGSVYRCPVWSAAFTPPELQNKDVSRIDRSPSNDMFGIAVLFFQLLMEGTRPFAGIFSDDPPDYDTSIANGYFPYGRNPKNLPPTTAPPFDMLPDTIRELFVQCFEDGYKNPASRPDAQTWFKALKASESLMVVCAANDQHRYFGHQKVCPWCERAARFQSSKLPKWDPFPSKERAKEFSQYGGFRYPAPTPARSLTSQPSQAAVFYATSTAIKLSQSITLHWHVPNAQSVTIKAGIRTIIKSGSNQGSVTLYPVKDTVYKLRARGTGLQKPPNLHISVSVPPAPDLLNTNELPLRHCLTLRDMLIGLSPVLLLKAELVRLFSITVMNKYSVLHSLIKLSQISIALMNYAPYTQLWQDSYPGTRKNRKGHIIFKNIRRLIGRR